MEDAFEKLEDLGSGTYSDVEHSIERRYGVAQHVAIKKLKRTAAPKRIYNEAKFLHQLQGQHGVVKLLRGARDKSYAILILEYFPSMDFRSYYQSLGVKGCATYMKRLLTALAHCHANNIVHCDIKPGNCLFNPCDHSFRLIDFGLAESLDAIEPNANRFGTKGFRSPEVLFGFRNALSPALDIFSVGVILMCILSGSPDDATAVSELTYLFGFAEMNKIAKRFQYELEYCNDEAKDLQSMCQALNKNNVYAFPNEAYDLLNRMLTVDPLLRISAKEALKHPYITNHA